MKTTDKPDHITFELRQFTNEEIEAILENAIPFRPMKHAHRDDLLCAMLGDTFNPATGVPLIFTLDRGVKRLLDGNHRLDAALSYQRETGKQIWFWCALNVSRIAARHVDGNIPRKLPAHLQQEGVAHYRHASTIILAQARVVLAKSSTLQSICGGVGSSRASKTRAGESITVDRRPTLSLLLDQWTRNKGEVDRWAQIGENLKRAKLPRPSFLSALGFQLAKVRGYNAQQFFELLASNKVLRDSRYLHVRHDPINVLRDRFIRERKSRARLDQIVFAALVIKAWVAWCEGRTIPRLQFRAVGPKAEPFPDHHPSTDA